MEEWKKTTISDLYEVSSLGRIRSLNSHCHIEPKILVNNLDTNGYEYVRIKSKNYKIHHLVYDAFIGERNKEGYEIDHIDSVPYNNKLSNLQYIPKGENILKRNMPLGLSDQRYIHKTKDKHDQIIYRFRIIRNKKSIVDKTFFTMEEALHAREEYFR
jgi:hypothetical protein